MTSKRPDVALEIVEGSSPQPGSRPAAGRAAPPAVSLREALDVAVEGRWLIAAALAACLAAGGAYVLLATPTYRSDVLVQVETRKTSADLIGDLSAAFGESSSSAETEMEILRSRTLVGAVVRDLHLDIVARPRRFPLLGRAIARRSTGEEVAGPLLGMRAFGWGGERIRVDRLDVPPRLLDKRLRLVASEAGRYDLLDDEGSLLVSGKVGELASSRDVAVFVSELRARPGLGFAVVRRSVEEAVADLQDAIRISQRGKKTGILSLALDGEDPRKIAAILDALAQTYVRLNVERRSAEAQKTLEFLEGQLPALRASLEAAEAELEGYRSRIGGADITLEAQAAVSRAVEVDKALSEAKVERAALRRKFTEDHPVLASLDGRIGRLEAESASIDARLKRLPETELESARRLRDVKVANELYVAVMNRAQELKVVKEGTIGNVRVLDPALVPTKPVSPEKVRVFGLALLLGLGGGLGLALGRRALGRGAEDPDEIERATGVAVYANVPHSTAQEDLVRRGRAADRLEVLAAAEPKDLAVESLRSLRTSLQFALVEASRNVVAIGGPAPRVGKSFVAVNLAHLLGESGKRVVLVDGDLRRGHVHRYFGLPRGPGLSDVIGGDVGLDEALRETGVPTVRLLSTGTIPPNPAELLGSERFERVVGELSSRFDLVVIDVPPVLAVTDAALIARASGVSLLVLRAGQHPLREIAAAVRALGRGGVRVHGIVLNDVRLDRGLGRRSQYHYQYRYE